MFLRTLEDNVEIKKIGDIADVVKGGKRLPKGINLKTNQNTHSYIRICDLSDSYIDN